MVDNRYEKGLALYLYGNVSIVYEDSGLVQFDVLSNGTNHFVEFEKDNSSWRCLCPDYLGRHKSAPGSFLCKHIWACLFKFMERFTVDLEVVK